MGIGIPRRIGSELRRGPFAAMALEMKSWMRFVAIPALVLAALGGSIFGVIELRQAVSRSQDLFRLDTVGSQIESDLEFQTQENRRAFLYALADPNQQLPYVDAARIADQNV